MIYTPRKVKKFGKGDLFNPEITNPYSDVGRFASTAINLFNKKDQYGVADNEALEVGSGVLSGASAGAAFGPIGAGVGAVVGGITSLVGQDDAKKKREIARANELDKYKQNSQSRLQSYNSYGVKQAKYGMIFGRGGVMPEVVEGGQEELLASNVSVYSGREHDTGGISLDINNDGNEEIEVENNEVIKDNMVLSDRIKPTDEMFNFVKNLGVTKQSNDTYASIAERLGIKKGNWEKKLSSTNLGQKEAAKRMIAKYDEAIDVLFQGQQLQKEQENSDFMKKYGKYKFPDGGKIDTKKLPVSRINNQPYENPIEYTREQFIKKQIPSNEEYVLSYFGKNPKARRVISGTSIDPNGNKFSQMVVDAFEDKYPTSFTYTPTGEIAGYDKNMQMSVVNLAKKPGQEKLFDKKRFGGYYAAGGKFGKFISDNAGSLSTVTGFLGNQAVINDMETNIAPEYTSDPINIYTDRTNYIKNNINEQFQTASRGLNQSTGQSNLALKSSLYANSINSMNDALDKETQRKDALSQQFQQLLQQNRQFNTQNSNAFKLESMNNRNQQRGLTQQNLDNTTRSIMGNKTQRDLQDLDLAKTYLKSYTGDTGVDDRFFESLPEGNKYIDMLRKMNRKKLNFGKTSSKSNKSYEFNPSNLTVDDSIPN